MIQIQLNTLFSNIKKNKTKILGFGSFSYGVYDYWKLLKQIVHDSAKYNKKIDIYIEDVYPLVKNINSLIHDKDKLNLSGDYNYNSDHPLKNYVNNKAYDCVEFSDFILTLKILNRANNDINIFGVGGLVEPTHFKSPQIEVLEKDEIYRSYPSLKQDKSIYSKFIHEHIDQLDDVNLFMANFIKFLYNDRKRFSIFVGHTDHIQQYSLGNKYKTTGYYLKDIFKNKYLSVGTAFEQGTINFVGRMIPARQIKKTRVYKEVDIYKEPKSHKIEDRGGLQRAVSNRFKQDKKGYIVLKLDGKDDLSYYTAGRLKLDDTRKNHNYRSIKDLDYIVYFFNPVSTHNILLNATPDT
jgi:hypothetical protein